MCGRGGGTTACPRPLKAVCFVGCNENNALKTYSKTLGFRLNTYKGSRPNLNLIESCDKRENNCNLWGRLFLAVGVHLARGMPHGGGGCCLLRARLPAKRQVGGTQSRHSSPSVSLFYTNTWHVKAYTKQMVRHAFLALHAPIPFQGAGPAAPGSFIGWVRQTPRPSRTPCCKCAPILAMHPQLPSSSQHGNYPPCPRKARWARAAQHRHPRRAAPPRPAAASHARKTRLLPPTRLTGRRRAGQTAPAGPRPSGWPRRQVHIHHQCAGNSQCAAQQCGAGLQCTGAREDSHISLGECRPSLQCTSFSIQKVMPCWERCGGAPTRPAGAWQPLPRRRSGRGLTGRGCRGVQPCWGQRVVVGRGALSPRCNGHASAQCAILLATGSLDVGV